MTVILGSRIYGDFSLSFFYLDICMYHFLQRFLRHLVIFFKGKQKNKENVGVIFSRILET